MGFHPGDQLIAAAANVNPHGFFEDERAIEANEAILQALGRDWRLPLPLPDGWQDNPAIAGPRTQIRALLRAQQQQGQWLLKDPRLCLLLPLWLTELAALDIEPRIVMMYRDPDAVAQSLLVRDELPIATGLQLWLTNLLGAEHQSRTLARYIVHYDQLVSEPTQQLAALARWLGIDDSIDQATRAIHPDARHHQSSQVKLKNLPLVAKTAALFAADQTRFPAPAAIDEVTAELNQALIHTQPIIEQQWLAANDLAAHFDQALSQLEEKTRSVELYEAASIENAETASKSYDTAVRAHELLAEKNEEVSRLTQEHAQLVENFTSYRTRTTQLIGEVSAVDPFIVSNDDAAQRPHESDDSHNDYEGVIDLAAENNSHTRVARYVTESSQGRRFRILEVGCSSGYFGHALQQLGHEVWGVETNPSAARDAAKLLDRVFCGSVEAFFIEEAFQDLAFDVILYGDVLEHLLDPVGALRASAERLTERGSIIASLPNVAHERVRMMLLDGRWEYSATGIMDSTHLRFYTRDSMVDLFSQANLQVKRLSPITLTGDAVGIPLEPERVQQAAELIVDREKDVFQYVIQASTFPPSITKHQGPSSIGRVNSLFKRDRSHRILCLPPLKGSSLYSIRLGEPIQRLTELFGGEVRLGDLHNCPQKDIEWAQTVVFQREANESMLELIRRLRRMGKRVVFDIDDLLLDVPEYLGVHEHCKAMRPTLEAVLWEVDAVSASTQPLADALRLYNSRVFVNPNYAWTSHPPIEHTNRLGGEQAQQDDTSRVRIIIASSDSVRVDFLVDALLELATDASLSIELVAIGPPGLYLREAGVPIAHANNMPHSQFKAYLASRPNTIALIPLDDNPFNRCKSAIKYFDYALAGVPCVCSNVVPYSPVIDSGSTGVLCANTRADWVSAVRSLVNDADLRREIATRSFTRVARQHNLNSTAQAWQHLLKNVPLPDPSTLVAPAIVSDPYARTAAQLARGTVRHLLKPASYSSAWRIFREDGIRGLRDKWKLVF